MSDLPEVPEEVEAEIVLLHLEPCTECDTLGRTCAHGRSAARARLAIRRALALKEAEVWREAARSYAIGMTRGEFKVYCRERAAEAEREAEQS